MQVDRIRRQTRVGTLLWISFALLVMVMFFGENLRYAMIVASSAGLSLLWLPTILSNNNLLDKHEHRMQRASLLLLLLITVYYLSGYSNINIVWYLRTIWWLLAGILSMYVYKCCSQKEKKHYLYFIAIVLFLFVISDSMQGRSVIAESGQDEATKLANAWVGSMLMLLTGFSFIVFLNVKSFMPRLVAALFIVSTLYVNIFVLQRATNFVMTLLEMAAIWIVTLKNRSIVKFSMGAIILVIILIFVTDFYVVILEWLIDVVPSERISDRLQSILFAMQYMSIEEGGGTMAARSDLMGVSWNTFTSSFSHIIIGAGDYKHGNTVIGNHSYIVDSLASYGIVGGILLYQIFRNQFFILTSKIDKKKDYFLFSQVSVVFAVYILRNFFGRMTFANVNIVLLVFFPLVIEYIQSAFAKKSHTKSA